MGSIRKKEISSDNLSLREPVLNILMVEDNPGDVVIFTELLKSSGFRFNLTHVTTLKETLLVCGEHDFDILLLDLGLPDSSGLETLKKIQVYKVKSPVIVMTGLDDEDLALASLREGAQDYLVKNRLTSDNILRSIKYGIERKKIQDLLQRHTHQFSILSSATGSIAKSEEISAIYTIACENIRLLLDKANAIAFEFSSSTSVSVSSIGWLEPWSEKIKNLTRIDLNNPVIQFTDQKNELLDLFNDGKLHEIKGSLYEIIAGIVSRNDCEELGKIIGMNNTYAIGFIKGENFYGGVIIFSQEMIGIDDINIIETLSGHASLSIHRRSVEKELRLSEFRLKKLSKELGNKVKERTHDLESANSRMHQELTVRILAEEALKKSESQLKELNATKDKFFNIVAHDLKNPFTSLLGSSELLFQNIHQMDIEKIKKLATILNDSAKSGYAILQNLLDWSRSQTGLIKFNPEKINLRKLIDENILNLELFSANKEIEIHSEVKNDMFIYSDKNILNTILRNILSNAVKFTHRGGKVVVSGLIDHYEVIISVKDTGTGISKENIEKLFRIDSKYSVPGTENEQGTGLGLKLCKEFVEKQGGKIWVESIENKGSDFKFSIPIRLHKSPQD